MPKNNTEKENNKRKKILFGTVISNSMKDTVVVNVERFIRHSKLGKYYKVRKRYKAHDAGNKCQLGDKVSIKESRPISKDKHFVVVQDQSQLQENVNN